MIVFAGVGSAVPASVFLLFSWVFSFLSTRFGRSAIAVGSGRGASLCGAAVVVPPGAESPASQRGAGAWTRASLRVVLCLRVFAPCARRPARAAAAAL